jgi:hypothetical protein
MKTIIILLITFISVSFWGQKINMELLQAPASPASNLLGVASSDINKPTDVTDLMLNLQNFPFNFIEKGSFAIDFAPYWIFPGKKDKTIAQMLDNKNAVPQTFVLSFAVKNIDSVSTVLPLNSIYTGLGFKFSILRGNADDETLAKHALLKTLLTKNAKIIAQDTSDEEIVKNDEKMIEYKTGMDEMLKPANGDDEKEQRIMDTTVYKELEKKFNDRLVELEPVMNDVRKKANKEYVENIAQIQAVQKDFRIVRTGFLLDIAGGTSVQFKNKEFGNSRIYNAGIWTVLGYATPKAGTPLLLVRYMYNPENDWMTTEGYEKIGNFSTLDAGLKYEYSPKDSKFTGSVEGLYRSFVSGSGMKPTWKFVVNLDYMVLPNQHLTLSLGKDFDNALIKNGNAIAALSLVSGIGSKRKVN